MLEQRIQQHFIDSADLKYLSAHALGKPVAAAVQALLACVTWPLLHPARPLLPTDDLYTHLSVTRHLARGDGFLCDIAYPLSFAWPFARVLPQPLVHRPPGWPVALLLPYAAVGGEHRSRPLSGSRPQASLNAGSDRR